MADLPVGLMAWLCPWGVVGRLVDGVVGMTNGEDHSPHTRQPVTRGGLMTRWWLDGWMD